MRFLIIYLTLFSATAMAESPRFDFGLGFFGLKVHHYRGSDQTKDYNFYVPYIYYKSENIEAEGAFIDTSFYKSRFLTMKFSIVVGPNVESETNRARKGMPELNYNLGIGPMAIFHIIKGPRFFLEIDSSVRQEFETDFQYTAAIGKTNTTYLTTRYKVRDFSIELGLGKMNADEDFHGHYYDVADKYATPARPSYDSDGGFSGNIILLSMKKKFGDILINGFIRHEDLSGTVFEDSPLVKQTDYYFFGLGVFYLIF